jgi:hypothetical protein
MAGIIKALKIVFVISLMVVFVYGMFYFINKEETSYPRYIIRTERDFYRTDTFTIDSNKCINFMAEEIRLFSLKPKTRTVQICGGRYIIEEKWKK